MIDINDKNICYFNLNNIKIEDENNNFYSVYEKIGDKFVHKITIFAYNFTDAYMRYNRLEKI